MGVNNSDIRELIENVLKRHGPIENRDLLRDDLVAALWGRLDWPKPKMTDTYSLLLRVQKAEAETGDPYHIGLYNGMSMMCANVDGDFDWIPMPCNPSAKEKSPEEIEKEASEMADMFYAVAVKNGIEDISVNGKADNGKLALTLAEVFVAVARGKGDSNA